MNHTAKLLALMGVALLVSEAGCNDPLNVKIPDVVPPSSLNDSASLATLRAGAVGDFAIAYTGDHPDGSGGTGEGVILYGGLLADEFIDSETFPTRIEVDARQTHNTNGDLDNWYRLLHRARHSAEAAAAKYAAILRAPITDPGYPEMFDLAGMSYVFFAETFCSGVPVSQLNPNGSITYGLPLSTTLLLDTAIARFNAALAVSSDAGMTNFATVGKARALLDLGQFTAAATAAAAVPTSFAYIETHSVNTDRENNGVFNGGATDARYSLADKEGGNGFPFLSTVDPRTPFVRDPGLFGFDGTTPLWDNLRYAGRAASITVATGVEARLIQAEAALKAGDTLLTTGAFYTNLNDPRTTPANRGYFDPTGAPAIAAVPALGPSDATAAGGAVNLLFAERARWLWLTAHRLGDLRRLVRPVASGGYGRAQNLVFPTGTYFKGQPGTYGVDVNLPVPITEQNNPNFTDCLDRNP
jgi:starch-binding outer membrane protein, SusD/RagB family